MNGPHTVNVTWRLNWIRRTETAVSLIFVVCLRQMMSVSWTTAVPLWHVELHLCWDTHEVRLRKSG